MAEIKQELVDKIAEATAGMSVGEMQRFGELLEAEAGLEGAVSRAKRAMTRQQAEARLEMAAAKARALQRGKADPKARKEADAELRSALRELEVLQ